MELLLHVDLKMMAPTVEALTEDIARWAREGATGVVIEWENCFPYPGLEDATRGYSTDDARAIIEACSRHGLHAVPLIQTLGHLEWLLSHGAYTDLREFADEPRQIRACDERTWALLRGQIDALLDVHSESPYVHLGADEAYRVKEIDRDDCSAVRDGAASVFLRHMAPLFDQVRDAGKRPIIWSDMVLRHPEAIDDFPKDVIFCDWRYNQRREYDKHVHVWNQQAASAETLDTLPAHSRELFEPYWKMDSPDYPNLVYQFPYTPFLRDRGYDVIAGPAVLYGGFPLTGPNLPGARANAREWLKAARHAGAMGTLNTCWQVRGALRERCDTGHRAFLLMGNSRPMPDDNAVAFDACAPFAADRPGEVAELLDALQPPCDPLSRTSPLTFDTESRTQRMVGFDSRWADLRKELAEMPEDAPAVAEHLEAVMRGQDTAAALTPLAAEHLEAAAWQLGAMEMSIRAMVWLMAWDIAHDLAPRIDLGDVTALIDTQAGAVTRYMQGRYLPLDVTVTREDRYDGLRRFLDHLA